MILAATLTNPPHHRILGWLGRDVLSYESTATHDDKNHCVTWNCAVHLRDDNPDPELLKAMGEGWKRVSDAAL